MEQKHAALPYYASRECEISSSDNRGAVAYIHGLDHKDQKIRDEGRATRNFILMACNSHYELLKVAEMVRDLLDCKNPRPTVKEMAVLEEAARLAIMYAGAVPR